MSSFGFSYDALSRRTQITRPNNVTTDYAYDNLSRLLSVLHKLSGGTIDGATYTVDAVGNRTAKANLLPSAPAESYTYDATYQLTQVVQNGSSTTESYTYDPVGNRLSSLAASPWNYNVSNQLTAISGSPGTTFTYDNNGNATSRTDATGTTSYTWDYENRLTSVTLPASGGTVSFTYDPWGRRIRKLSGTSATIFAYDDDNAVEEVDGNGIVLARFSHTLATDEALVTVRAGSTRFYHADGLGSITSLTDDNGSLESAYVFDAFGNQVSSTGAFTNWHRYTAREFDPETGLLFYRARFYDPRIGRFLSEDPVGFYDGVNLFAYVGNHPTLFVDPSGLTKLKGFPPDKEQKMRDAIEKVKDKLSEECGTNCAGKDAPKLLEKLEKATFVYLSKTSGCGQVGPLTFFGLRKSPGITAGAFNPGLCDKLECTVLHEVSHIGLGSQGRAYELEKKCFGCSVPEKKKEEKKEKK